MLTIRKLTSQDYSDVLSLNGEAQPHVAQLDEAELKRLHAISQSHLVAEQQDCIVGYLLAFARGDAYDGEEFNALSELTPQSFVYIDQVATLSSLRRAGVARSLYSALETSATANGTRLLCCEVNTSPRNPDSLSFHRRLDFREVGALVAGDGRGVALLQKQLSAT